MRNRLLSDIAIVCGILAIVISVYFIASIVLMDGFLRLEKQDVSEDLNRIQATLDQETASLMAAANTIAYRDSSYDFINQPNVTYLRETINLVLMTEYQLNLVVIRDNQNRVLYAEGFDWRAQTWRLLPPDLLPQFDQKYPALINPQPGKPAGGLVMIGPAPAILTAYPIMRSSGAWAQPLEP